MQILPFTIPLTYLFLLPPPGDYSDIVGSEDTWANAASEYSAIPEDEDESNGAAVVGVSAAVMPLPGLSLADKWRLVRPLLPKYMLPLCKLSNKLSRGMCLPFEFSLRLHCAFHLL